MADLKEMQDKWTKRWSESKIFEASPDSRTKFFGTFPYPYVNSYLHLGHFYTSMRLEALSRFKRMTGHNVLYAQGWHCTGSPIVSTAKRVADKEPKQIEILKKQGFSDEEIEKFADPKEWIKFFPDEARKDFTKMGYSIDWRRSFITTELNPHYDRFIRWQFRKLKDKNYVVKGKFPVVWDPVENAPVGDHDRIEGEGETPQEYVLVKHRLDGRWVVTATLRPDTIMGVTNLYVNPDSELVEAKVNNEVWIISERVAKELVFQDKKVEVLKKISGKDLIGKRVDEFSGSKVLILPASFVNAEVGTGIVHSVPSDSADDLIALKDLQGNEEECRKFGLDVEEVKAIRPIAVIKIPGYGEIPAADIIKKLGIKSQKDSSKLKEAKELLYKDGFYKGALNHLYTKGFSENLEGKKVDEVKELIKEELIETDFGDRYYQLTGRVLARSLGECIVKIVDDQWFMAYGDDGWKALAHKCLDSMKLYPEKTRSQFEYVLDWLRNWACTREFGLGTKLPWDEKWLIESLSDSTIYMAYYTIAHKIKELPVELIDDNFFDYVFHGKTDAAVKIDRNIAEELRKEFEYYYPMDFRNTGKDLIQNHMSFCIFNHCAIFPEKHWPRSFGLNGHVLVDGDKMSKSKGNFITIRQAYEDYGADAARFTALSGGEGIDDANFDREMAKAMVPKVEAMLIFAKENYNIGREEHLSIDKWFEHKIDSLVKRTTDAYEETLFRTGIQICYFEMQNALKWYMKRCMNNPCKKTINKFIETQAILLAPITPFIAEEIWEFIGRTGFISQAEWPEVKVVREDRSEDLIRDTMDDINSVLNLLKISKPKQVKLFVSEKWKYELYDALRSKIKETRDMKSIMDSLPEDVKKRKETIMMIQKVLKSGVPDSSRQEAEFEVLAESAGFLGKEFGCIVEVHLAEESQEQKARNAMPGKVAILVS
jgi:leucyl-tRNA synthetase